MAEVTILDVQTKLDIPPERILKKALEADLEGVVVLGYTKDGLYYMAASYADQSTTLWLLETLRHHLMQAELLGANDDD